MPCWTSTTPITSSREDRHVVLLTDLRHRAATSRALSQEFGSFARQQVSSLTARRLVCIRHRDTGPSPGVVIWGVIGYTSRSPLVRIEGTLNSARYISGVL
ncbi:uncharacterized protein TNCV_4225131 [Trichonephila clavipes]|uniref:Uncharacterized protein n=1 Tax=Trichonephila clavipes TaxID=2585209 RepID=A0A8X6VRJ4_TRICX|nr:uncharacterized protein TNCV_4225131 [Trichonephila clavipes]